MATIKITCDNCDSILEATAISDETAIAMTHEFEATHKECL